MAGNLVKWWKHKILGGYKQFSVQECTTDSEELMYHQVRASSSCSAPPDLLLVSDRENNIPLRSPVVNIIGPTTAPATTTTSPSSSALNGCHITSATNNNQRHNQKLQHHHVTATQQQQHQLSLAYNGTKDITNTKQQQQHHHQKQSSAIANSLSHSKHGQQLPQQQDCQQQQPSFQDIEGQLEATANNHSSTRHAHQAQQSHNHHQSHQQQRSEDHIRLEEFTCDVSVEGGKSSQPLQFSFTFYDLDGHHGKITKDDIVGIVYTIYESIGKSVVVPHSGSKTINVRLTVSPEGKSKSSKTKKTANSSSNALVLDSAQKSAPLSSAAAQAARRLHRYRPRKLIKSDEEDDDSNSDKERDITATTNHTNLSHIMSQHKSSTKTHKLHHKLKTEHHCCQTPASQTLNNADLVNSPLDNIYDNLKANTTATSPETCRECLTALEENRSAAISPIGQQQQYPANNKLSATSTTNEAYMKHVASTRIKMLRKSRKQKHQDCLETRQRSLSVGNETCWKNRHLQKQQTAQQQLLWHAEQQLNQSANGGSSVIMDGVQLRNPLKAGAHISGVKSSSSSAQKRNSAECWKSALNRNDLISIIRESMEKNRLCFQLNGKPQANVSPIRHSQPPPPPTTQQQHQQHLLHSSSKQSHHHQQHQTSTTAPTTSTHQHHQRQRSNTVSKIPTLIAHHNNSSISNNSSAQHQSSHYHRSSSCANTISNNNNNHHHQQQQHDTSLHDTHNNTNSSNSNNIYQPHIPIYHQQLPINPAVIAAHNALLSGGSGTGAIGSNSTSAVGHHSKMNLCGYDSFLHATICGGGGLSHSPPAHSSLAGVNVTSPTTLAATAVGNIGPQQIATVQPIMSSSNTHSANKHLSLAAVTPNQVKTSKILRSGSYAQTHAHTTQNSPQYHGYQRLPSSSKHNLAALHLVSPSMERPPLDQLDKWRREQVKNYDQLLYAKLSEKLQQTNLVSSSPVSVNLRESQQRRKHRIMKQRRGHHHNVVQDANNVSSAIMSNKLCVREDSDYATMLPIEGDAVECENLLAQSSDEENQSQNESPLQNEDKLREPNLNSNNRHVAEGTLVDLDDVGDDEEDEEEDLSLQTSHKLTKLPLNADTLLRVQEDEAHDLHLEDPLDIEEDLEEDLIDDLDDVDVVGLTTESGRNSAASNVSSNAAGGGASLANANSAANTSTTSSSLIHRYVHEHIHHHYHHFEEKEE